MDRTKIKYELCIESPIRTGNLLTPSAFVFRGNNTLEAIVGCDGKIEPAVGVSTCQGKTATTQVISFHVKTEVKAINEDCKLPVSKDGMIWRYSLRQGECIFEFRSENEDFHKTWTYGYNDYMKR